MRVVSGFVRDADHREQPDALSGGVGISSGKLPLDDGGRVRFPGGRAAWSSSSGPDDEALLRSEFLEALVPVAALEEKRGAHLDAASATLLARHYAEWRSLFPYFERLPAFGGAEFQALAAFATATLDLPSAARNNVVGEWHSLVKPSCWARRPGPLDQAAAARAFARVCAVLSGPDPSPNALAALREIAGEQGSLDEALATRLLRLNGPPRASFDRVRELQSAPSLDAALAAPTLPTTLAALSGAVYAAVFEPECLLISEDPRVLSWHRFVLSVNPKVRSEFFPMELVRATMASGSYLTGGFMTFEETAARPGALQAASGIGRRAGSRGAGSRLARPRRGRAAQRSPVPRQRAAGGGARHRDRWPRALRQRRTARRVDDCSTMASPFVSPALKTKARPFPSPCCSTPPEACKTPSRP